MKKLLSIAIIAALPFAANADPVGPAAVPSNETPVVATASGPYQTAQIGNNDGEHIASTAYVKGAYNDAIAAVNKVNSDKQNQLINSALDQHMASGVVGADDVSSIVDNLLYGPNNEITARYQTIAANTTNGETTDLDEVLISAKAILNTIRKAGQTVQDNVEYNIIENKRVTARDTWGSNHTTKVMLSDAD